MEQKANLTAWKKMQLDIIYDDFGGDMVTYRIQRQDNTRGTEGL